MQRVRIFIGLLAAVILMIGAAPASASRDACNPCPSDCPMTGQMAKATADHHAPTPGKTGGAEAPCKSGVACQAAFAVPLVPETAAEIVLATETARHDLIVALAAPSRPPDRNLRPPILR
jgi:hypothetical protein